MLNKKESNMEKFKIGQKVILNCKNFVAKKHLDDDGWFGVYGTITGFTNKRIKAVNDLRETEGFYKPENVQIIN
jgi:exoribonuclease II